MASVGALRTFGAPAPLTLGVRPFSDMKQRAFVYPLALVLASTHQYSVADPVEGKLPTYCNERSGEFFVSSGGDAPTNNAERYTKRKVDWASLLKVGPQKNQWGDPLRTGSRFKVVQCGKVSISFSSGFLNLNPQGELGALDFPVIQVKQGKRTLLPTTALEQCAINFSRYTYFGDCPDSWAQSIEVQLIGSAYQVKVTRRYDDAQYNEVQKIDVLR